MPSDIDPNDDPNTDPKEPDPTDMDALKAQWREETLEELRAEAEKAVSGIKQKNTELLARMRKLNTDIEEIGTPEEREQLKKLQLQIAQDEELALFAKGDREAYNNRLTGRLKESQTRELQARDKKIDELAKGQETYRNKFQRTVIDNDIMKAAALAKIEETAYNDALRAAREVFVMNEDDEIQPLDAKGNVVYGKDGQTPMSMGEWFEAQMDDKASPHWWLAREGMGTKSSKGPVGPARQKSSMTSAEKAHYIRDHGREAYLQLAG